MSKVPDFKPIIFSFETINFRIMRVTMKLLSGITFMFDVDMRENIDITVNPDNKIVNVNNDGGFYLVIDDENGTLNFGKVWDCCQELIVPVKYLEPLLDKFRELVQ